MNSIKMKMASNWVDELLNVTCWSPGDGYPKLGAISFDIPYKKKSDISKGADVKWSVSTLVVAPLTVFALADVSNVSWRDFKLFDKELSSKWIDINKLKGHILTMESEFLLSQIKKDKTVIHPYLELSSLVRNKANYMGAGIGQLVSLDLHEIDVMFLGSWVSAFESESGFKNCFYNAISVLDKRLGSCMRIYQLPSQKYMTPSSLNSQIQDKSWPKSHSEWLLEETSFLEKHVLDQMIKPVHLKKGNKSFL